MLYLNCEVKKPLLSLDELKEWLSCRSDEKASEMRKLFKIQSPACREETEAKCWQFLETRLSLLLAQYKTSDAEVSKQA